MKMEYLRKREEREEKESAQRREVERLKLEREKAEFEHQKQTSSHKQKTERAIVNHSSLSYCYISDRLTALCYRNFYPVKILIPALRKQQQSS